MQKFIFCSIFNIFLAINVCAQYKSFKLTPKGDTLNIVDKNNFKQGKWIIHVEELRGEPGYEEEGIFVNNRKEGIWRKYSLEGDIIAVEFYKFGAKHGIQQYYTYLGNLYREESWRSYNPDAPYDTIPVYGSGNNEIIDYKIIRVEAYSVKHGSWKFFDPHTGKLVKEETYDRGALQAPAATAATKETTTDKDKPKKVEKTPEMLEWEKKNKKKKKALRDGKTSI